METSCTVAIVVGGGAVPAPAVDHDLVIAADGGLDAARAAGFEPQVLVGDLDSISPAGLAWAEDHGVEIRRHPVDKDHTDTALALERALDAHPDTIVLYGPSVLDRIDHLLGALIALGSPSLASVRHVSARFGTNVVHVLHAAHGISFGLPPHTVFSLLALHGPCTGVDVSGARWPLADATLLPAETRGISNESTGEAIEISTRSGVLTVVVPAVAA